MGFMMVGVRHELVEQVVGPGQLDDVFGRQERDEPLLRLRPRRALSSAEAGQFRGQLRPSARRSRPDPKHSNFDRTRLSSFDRTTTNGNDFRVGKAG
jgi:hypothetical protein